MEQIRLGRTGLMVGCVGFGCLPIQRISVEESTALLRKAVEGGVNFFDTARGYSDSEEKVGHAFADMRDDVIIATKMSAPNRTKLLETLEVSLTNLQTDHVDVLQLHNPREVPDPDDPESSYAGLKEAQRQGKARFIGITNHRLDVAIQAAKSGLFDTMQFPLSAISAATDLRLIDLCREQDIGVIAMKALCGGLLTNIPGAFAFLRQYDHLVPIWGMQRESELNQFIGLAADPPPMDAAMLAAIERDREELAGDYCRGCGYCLPCPESIHIPVAARMKFLLERAPWRKFVDDESRALMEKTKDCRECGQCGQRCPYSLNIPPLLRKMYDDYQQFLSEHVSA
jgi:uncharacterized protein